MQELFVKPHLWLIGIILYQLLSWLPKNRLVVFLYAVGSACLTYFLFFDSAATRTGFVFLMAAAFLQFLALTFYRKMLVAFLPFVFLIFIRLLSIFELSDYAVYLGSWSTTLIAQSGLYRKELILLGCSYFIFKLSLYSIAFLNKDERPSFFQMVSYLFFPFQFVVGPLTPFAQFQNALRERVSISIRTALLSFFRILVGFTKLFFLSGLFYQMTFTRSFTEGSILTVSQFLISLFSYSFYIYFNFSGFCDAVIGCSTLSSVPCAENFNHPFQSTNLKDFWKRWHMSLTDYLQTLIFNPLVRILGQRRWNFKFSVNFSTCLVFLVMGLWHGFAWNYLIFAGLHAVGLIFLNLFPQKWISSNLTCKILTFSYVTVAFFFFENSLDKARLIFQSLQF